MEIEGNDFADVVGRMSSENLKKIYNIYSEDSDSETEGVEKREKPQLILGSPPICITTAEELNKIRISRHKMERLFALPELEKLLVNCYVRISIVSKTKGREYCAAKILALVETEKVYNFGTTRTNKALRLQNGKTDSVVQLAFISNQDFTEAEFEHLCTTSRANNSPMPTPEMIQKKHQDIISALQYEFKDEDVDKIVEEKKFFRMYPTNNAKKKIEFIYERHNAQLHGNECLANDLNARLKGLEDRASSIELRRTQSIRMISVINELKRKQNMVNAERAILEEVRGSKHIKVDDPFSRRPTKPRLFIKASNETREIRVPETKSCKSPENTVIKEIPAERTKDIDMYKLHNFDIDVNIDLSEIVGI